MLEIIRLENKNAAQIFVPYFTFTVGTFSRNFYLPIVREIRLFSDT